MFRLSILVIVPTVVALTGCGPGYKTVPVSGRITLDGKPLADAMILTQPIGEGENVTPGPGSMARTDADGKFTLEFQHEEVVGAAPGKCSVKIKQIGEDKPSSDDTVSAVVLRSRVPLDFQQGLVTYTIPEEGTDAMNFDLKSERRR